MANIVVSWTVFSLINAEDVNIGKTISKGCPDGFQVIGGECLQMDDMIRANFTEAEAICQGLDSHLVELNDANLLSAIFQHLTSHDMTSLGYWTGAHKHDGDSKTWQWISDENDVRMGTPLWGDWTIGRQDPTDGYGDCGFLNRDTNYFLHNELCYASLYGTICHFKENAAPKSRPPELECEAPFTDIGGRCLIVNFLTPDTWSYAKEFCESFQGMLAKIDDANFLGDVVSYIQEMGLTETSYWIGAHQESAHEPWIWTDCSNVTMGTPFWGDDDHLPSNQYPYDPSLNCAMLDKDEFYFFVNGDCKSDTNGVICEFVAIEI
ncbi:unnamed protein product, partial [Meganyctiphanes norvegica]